MKKMILLLAVILPLATVNAQGGWGYNHGNNNNNGQHGSWNNTPTVGMPTGQFEVLRREISMRRFDQGKMMLAKQAAVNNRMSSAQVRQITSMFAFENSRLEFAKFAYAYVADPGSYTVVYGAMGFQSSVAALDQFINGSTIVYTGGAGGAWGGDEGGHGSGHDHGGCHNSPPPAPVIYAMDQQNFQFLLCSIDKACFESTKEDIAETALISNYFTSEQVRAIMNAFTFESTKLDFAKHAYAKVIDPQMYFLVNDAFTFESSICDLNRFIAGR
jgi:hypothetical protein